MRISVFGLGYVGIVSAACFAARGHDVIGVDVSDAKVAMVNEGRTPVVEERIGGLIADAVGRGALRATTSAPEALAGCDVALVCVGTPSAQNGSLSTEYLERVSSDIGRSLDGSRRLVIAFRSTMLPGTCEGLLIPAIETASGQRAGDGFGVCVNPEFLREGTSVADFYDPPKTVIGEGDPQSGETLAALYEGLPGPVFRVPIRVAELAKYVDNAYHALKVGFANEIGAICKASDVDSHAVMDIFKSDTKLNVSAAYLTPGFAFGGSCLPKDLRAITYHARRNDVSIPILDNVLVSNDAHLTRAYQAVLADGGRRVAMLGLSFKSGTDDLRESPMVELAERLLGRGFELRIHDEQVLESRLQGANRAYVDSRIPHLSGLMTAEPRDAIEGADVLIVGSKSPRVVEAVAEARDCAVIDLVRLPEAHRLDDGVRYVALCW